MASSDLRGLYLGGFAKVEPQQAEDKLGLAILKKRFVPGKC